MVARLVNKRLTREELLDWHHEQWTNSLSGNCIFIPRCPTLSESLMALGKALNIPQRCLSAVSERQFVIHYSRGNTDVGCYPMGSPLHQLHCNCCDDHILADSPYTNDIYHCRYCDLHACSACLQNEMCFICRYYDDDREEAFEPSCKREELLQEVYDRSSDAWQPNDHDEFTYFPFADAQLQTSDHCDSDPQDLHRKRRFTWLHGSIN